MNFVEMIVLIRRTAGAEVFYSTFINIAGNIYFNLGVINMSLNGKLEKSASVKVKHDTDRSYEKGVDALIGNDFELRWLGLPKWLKSAAARADFSGEY